MQIKQIKLEIMDWCLIGYCRRCFFLLCHFLFRTKKCGNIYYQENRVIIMYGEHNVIYSLNAIYQKPKRQQALSHAMTAFEFRGVTAVFGTENWLGNLFSPSISHLLGLPKLGQPVSTKGKKIKKGVTL